MTAISLNVVGYPPVKNEAKSMLAAGHTHADRVHALLRAARDAVAASGWPEPGPDASLGLEVVLTAPSAPPSDATNYLGGVGDVLEQKAHRGVLDHLRELAQVALYGNDRQFHEVHYRWDRGAEVGYTVRIWVR